MCPPTDARPKPWPGNCDRGSSTAKFRYSTIGCWIRSPSGPRREHVHTPLGPHVVIWGPIGHWASLEHVIVSGGANALVLTMQCVPSRAAHPKFPGSVTLYVLEEGLGRRAHVHGLIPISI